MNGLCSIAKKMVLSVSILTMVACTFDKVSSLDERRSVDAQMSDGAEVLLLCSEDPLLTAERLSRANSVEIRKLKSGETYSFDQPIEIGNELQRVLVSQLETEPCLSQANSVDADDVGMTLLAIPVVAVFVPLAILSTLDQGSCC